MACNSPSTLYQYGMILTGRTPRSHHVGPGCASVAALIACASWDRIDRPCSTGHMGGPYRVSGADVPASRAHRELFGSWGNGGGLSFVGHLHALGT